MARYLLAACVARTIAFQAARTSRRALGAARALPPHLETVKADVAGGDALLLDVRLDRLEVRRQRPRGA